MYVLYSGGAGLMEFCPKCGSLMMPKKVKGKVVLICVSCGFEKTVESAKIAELYEISEKIHHSPKEEIAVIEENLETAPTEHIVCPKCGYDEAYVIEIPTISEDMDAEAIYYKCKKCRYSWRE